MPISTTNLIELDVSEVKVLGKSLATIARENPKAIRRALGMQVRNTQKSIAATVRNYAIRHRVEGKQRTILKFPPRHKITVALHGRKGGGALGAVRAVSVDAKGDTVAVGYKGSLASYAVRWQTGGDTGLRDPRVLPYAMWALHPAEFAAVNSDPAFRHEVYWALGAAFGIHNEDQLRAADADTASPARKAMTRLAMRRMGMDEGEVPATWRGRPFIDPLADDLKSRFIPSVSSILEKTLKKELPK